VQEVHLILIWNGAIEKVLFQETLFLPQTLIDLLRTFTDLLRETRNL